MSPSAANRVHTYIHYDTLIHTFVHVHGPDSLVSVAAGGLANVDGRIHHRSIWCQQQGIFDL
jgi:hypothetical protein